MIQTFFIIIILRENRYVVCYDRKVKFGVKPNKRFLLWKNRPTVIILNRPRATMIVWFLLNERKLDADLYTKNNNVKLTRVFETKFLGIIITVTLQLNKRTLLITNKMFKVGGIFGRPIDSILRRARYKHRPAVMKQLYVTSGAWTIIAYSLF